MSVKNVNSSMYCDPIDAQKWSLVSVNTDRTMEGWDGWKKRSNNGINRVRDTSKSPECEIAFLYLLVVL